MDNHKNKMNREVRRMIQHCKATNKTKPPALEELIATQLTDELMDKFKINEKKRKRLREFQSEFTRKYKLKELKNRLVPLYPEVPRLNESHKKIRSYMNNCPTTEMSTFQETCIRNRIAVRDLAVKYKHIVDNIMAEAKDDFVMITHNAGVSIFIMRKGKVRLTRHIPLYWLIHHAEIFSKPLVTFIPLFR